MPGIASAATSIVIAHIAAGSKRIRVGAGGIMLPNHAPYVIAEQFGTLERLFPGRIDLGLLAARQELDEITLRALRRTPDAAESFPQDERAVMTIANLFRGPKRDLPGAAPTNPASRDAAAGASRTGPSVPREALRPA